MMSGIREQLLKEFMDDEREQIECCPSFKEGKCKEKTCEDYIICKKVFEMEMEKEGR